VVILSTTAERCVPRMQESLMKTDLNSAASARARNPAPWPAHDWGRSTALTAASVFASADADVVEARLGDGTQVRIRPIRRTDLELERRFMAGLSLHTRYLSLLSGRELMPGELENWTDTDPTRRLALIAVAADGDETQQLGVARCVLDDETRWDFAVVVADAWQHRGLGEALLRRLMEYADEAGVETLSSLTLSENHRMVSLARRLGFTARREPGDATVMRIERRLRA
jgi:GNAT superfamily N-acetyltransferase